MNLGIYRIETYSVDVNGQSTQRQRIVYTANNGIDFFVERYYGEIRDGYVGETNRFKDLLYTCLKSHIVGESLVIKDSTGVPLIYLTISSIQSVQRDGSLKLTILDSQVEPVSLEFLTIYDAEQAYSLFNYVLQNPTLDINSLGADLTPPQIFFNMDFYGSVINLDGSSNTGPFSTIDGVFYTINVDTATFTLPFPLEGSVIVTGIVYDVIDNRDGSMSITGDNISIYNNSVDIANKVDNISGPGTYKLLITTSDLGSNSCLATFTMNVI